MDDTGEVVGETNFVISETFLLSHWKECPICGQEENVEDFLEAYVPEDDGQYLYDNQPPHTRDFSRELGGFFLKYNGTYGII